MVQYKRTDGRSNDQLRPITITRKYLTHPEGSCLIEFGDTKIICTASIEQGLPKWKDPGTGGWVTAEYAMLPRSTDRRKRRVGPQWIDNRAIEIQRLIGRSIRAVADMGSFGDRRITVDCDVIQADGGTRTASITGAYIALHDALVKANVRDKEGELALYDSASAISVGIVRGELLLDLNYIEDSSADVDMNVVIAGDGRIIEVQGTGEQRPYSYTELTAMVELAIAGTTQINRIVSQMVSRKMDSIHVD